MNLEQKDILNFFRDFAEWMAKREMTALALIGGGCSLVLQTAFRKTAHDIDIRIRVTNIKGQEVRLGDTGHINVMKEFHTEYGDKYPIDIKYMEHMAIGGRFGFGSYRTPTIPCGSYKDKDGCGVTYYLTGLQHEYMTKRIRINQSLLRMKALIDIKDCFRLRVARSSKFRTPNNQSYLIV